MKRAELNFLAAEAGGDDAGEPGEGGHGTMSERLTEEQLAELERLREALAEAAKVLDSATFRATTKAGNAARARGWLTRWADLPEVGAALFGDGKR